MATQPVVVAIVRHGARLDASDSKWRDTAERPYDTPLSYGGWIQCQVLGARIANELQYLDAQKNNAGGGSRKRRRIIVHSSPYLRCVQTSIAVGAGIRDTLSRSIHAPGRKPSQLSYEIKEDDEHEPENDHMRLRLDCFLEEWRSAGYFEKTTPPAPSEQLVANAKEHFQMPAEDIKGADLSASMEETGAIDWDEKSADVNSLPVHEKMNLRAMAATGVAKRARHLSDVASGSHVGRPRRSTVGYRPPIPMYALAPQDPIPVGYVAHARDACISLDQDWDSMSCGDGGPFDEEWGSMHRRVASGLQKTLANYASDTEETVLIFVTHQACCNALIRIMTGAPALHDIGTASLTMAVRRPEPLSSSAVPISPTARRGSLDMGIAQEFEMKIIASTEHLRGGSNPLGLNSPRLGKSPAFASRRAVGADSLEGFSLGDPWKQQPHVMNRSRSHRSSEADESPAASEGLWRNGSSRTDSVSSAAAVEDLALPPPQLWGGGGDGGSGTAVAAETRSINAAANLPVRSASQRGMWGGESSIQRDKSPGKRSWTAVERSPL